MHTIIHQGLQRACWARHHHTSAQCQLRVHVPRAVSTQQEPYAQAELQEEYKEEQQLKGNFTILYEDEDLVAIDKPQGVFVHRPQDGWPIPQEENGLFLLKHQIGGQWLWPVHRLDRATSGVTIYCKSVVAASAVGRAMRGRQVHKTYHCLVRGYTDTLGEIDKSLTGQESRTLYQTLARMQVPMQVGKWSQARYSLLRVEPLTGRTHQIRRHLNHISHPIVGDTEHGDKTHNRAFIQRGLGGMFLCATQLELIHPTKGTPLRISVQNEDWASRWNSAFMVLGMCPMLQPTTEHLPHTADRPFVWGADLTQADLASSHQQPGKRSSMPSTAHEALSGLGNKLRPMEPAFEEQEAEEPVRGAVGQQSALQQAVALSKRPLHEVLAALQNRGGQPIMASESPAPPGWHGQPVTALHLCAALHIASEQLPVKAAGSPQLLDTDY